MIKSPLSIIAAVSTLIIVALWPMQTNIRHLAPSDFLQQVSEPRMEPINLNSEPVFKIYIGPQAEVNNGPIMIAELKNFNDQDWLQKKSDLSHKRPYLFPKTVGIYLATYARTNHCSVSLALDKAWLSKPLNCSDLQDNALAFFEFDQPISPGVYNATLNWVPTRPGNEIAVYLYRSSDNGFITDTFTKYPNTNFVKVFWIWFQQSPNVASIYLLICILSFLTLFLGKQRIKWLALSGLLLAGHGVISRPFSGHDETAHIKMLQKQIDDAYLVNQNLNHTAHNAMASGDFFRLHEAPWLSPEACPHMILKHCGITQRPMVLYAYYAPILRALGINPGSANQLLMTGRFINYTILIGFLGLLFSIFGKVTILTLAPLLVLFGGFYTQLASISNDPPMFMVGIMAAVLIFESVISGVSKRSIVGYLILCSMAWFGPKIDVSGYLIIPYLVLIPIFWTIRLESNMTPSRFIGTTMLIQMIALITAVIFTANHFWRELTHIAKEIQSFAPFIPYLKNFLKFNVSTGTTALVEYFKSFMGTFVWGHSYFPDIFYWASFFLCIWLIYKGLCLIAHRYSMGSRIIILALFSLLLAFQVICTFIAFETSLSMPEIVIASYLKVRLTAPAVGGFVGLLMIGMYETMRRKSHGSFLFSLLWIWALAMLIHFYPDFYWADAF